MSSLYVYMYSKLGIGIQYEKKMKGCVYAWNSWQENKFPSFLAGLFDFLFMEMVNMVFKSLWEIEAGINFSIPDKNSTGFNLLQDNYHLFNIWIQIVLKWV